jgi:type II secretory pathway pseudopilin PulG
MPNKSMRLKLILFLCRSRSPVPDSGLSMLEVLVAMMVVFLTFMTSLNGLLYAAMFQVKAERQAQATYWIQQDLEQVKAAAASYTSTSGCPSSVGTNFNNTANAGSIPPISIPTKPLLGKSYRIARAVVVSNNLLQITYRVGENYVAGTGQTDTNGDLIADDQTGKTSIIATLYTEIMPAGALSCS